MLKIDIEVDSKDLLYIENYCSVHKKTFGEFLKECLDLHRKPETVKEETKSKKNDRKKKVSDSINE